MSMEDVAINALVAIAIFGGLVYVMRHRHHEHEQHEHEKK